MKLSICIVNYNSKSLLSACLESIAHHPPCCEYEVVVVDNGSVDGSQGCVQRHTSARLIQNVTNEGFARGNNTAVDESRGDLLLLLNADTEVQTRALDELVSAAEANPMAGQITARLVNRDGSAQVGFNVRRLPGYASSVSQLLLLDEAFPNNPFKRSADCEALDYDRLQTVEQPAASALLVRRTAWEQLGGFDSKFPNWYNDCDLSMRMLAAGWESWLCPSARVFHHGGKGAAARELVGAMIEVYQSQRLYFKKHRGVTGYWLISGMTICGMLLRSLVLRIFPNRGRHGSGVVARTDSAALRYAYEAVLVDTLRTWRSLVASARSQGCEIGSGGSN